MWPSKQINTKAFDYYPALKKIREHFEEHYSDALSLSEAAKMAAFEAKHFSKFFRAQVGIGFKQWTDFIRIERAMMLMRTEHQSITDIAFAVGFRDLRAFQRAFKKHAKITAREFRKAIIAGLTAADP